MNQNTRKDSALYQELFEHAQLMMLIIDPDSGSIVDANVAALQFFGYTRKALVGFHISKIVSFPFTKIKQSVTQSTDRGRHHFQFDYQSDATQTRQVDVYAVLVKRSDQKLLYSILQDTTEQRTAQASLLESESTIRAMINATSSLVYLFDVKFNIINLNLPGAQLFDQTPESMIGKNFKSYLKKNDFSHLQSIINEVIRQRSPISFQDIRKSRFYDVSLYPIFDKKNSVDKICAFLNDLTELKQSEKILTAVETAGAICHEMNQPLQVIMGNLELLKLSIAENDPLCDYVKTMTAHVEKLGRITRKLAHITQYKTKKYVQGSIFDIDNSSTL